MRETLDLVREGRELVEYCAGELEAVGKGLEELRLDELVKRLEGGAPQESGLSRTVRGGLGAEPPVDLRLLPLRGDLPADRPAGVVRGVHVEVVALRVALDAASAVASLPFGVMHAAELPAPPDFGCLRLITTGPAALEPPLWMCAAIGFLSDRITIE